jgi:hypothetical protein
MLQEAQVEAQALSQQTPSTQKPEGHCEAAVQDVPSVVAEQAPAPVHVPGLLSSGVRQAWVGVG